MWPDCTCKLDAARAGFAQIIALCRTMLEACRHADKKLRDVATLFGGISALILAADQVHEVFDDEYGFNEILQKHASEEQKALQALRCALDLLSKTDSALLKPTDPDA